MKDCLGSSGPESPRQKDLLLPLVSHNPGSLGQDSRESFISSAPGSELGPGLEENTQGPCLQGLPGQ